MVALNERLLKRLLSEYVRYHYEDRTHLGLEKRIPHGRIRSIAWGGAPSQERLGGSRKSILGQVLEMVAGVRFELTTTFGL
jgi:hypothetical protein